MKFKVVVNAQYGGFSLSNEVLRMLAERRSMSIDEVKDTYVYCMSDDYQIRTCPDLVAVIEKLGEKASGVCSVYGDLEVWEFEDEFGRFAIDEYDGKECAYTPAMQQWHITLNNQKGSK
jgi:hypothetical protein